MAFVLADRPREQATFAGGTGAVTLTTTPVSSFQSFLSGWGASGSGWVCLVLGSQWEVCEASIDAGGTTLTRGTLVSSSTGSRVNFSAGTIDCFAVIPSVGIPRAAKQVFTASGTFTAPATTRADTVFKVTVTGGGGGGAGGSTGNITGEGAGAGGTSIKWYTGLVAGTAYTVTIGAAGAAGAAGADGTTGGNSSFAGPGTTITGNGGSLGARFGIAGALGGAASNGDINLPGGPGGGCVAGSAAYSPGGFGGSSMFGRGGQGGVNSGGTQAGAAGVGYGAGGGGGGAAAANQAAGGAGTAGICIVEWVL